MSNQTPYTTKLGEEPKGFLGLGALIYTFHFDYHDADTEDSYVQYVHTFVMLHDICYTDAHLNMQ